MYNTIVIGAGQAGLSIGYYLKQYNESFVILDRGKEVGDSWKNRYDSLVLFTPRMYDSLPGLPLEGEEHGFPSKNEIVNYFKQYVANFNLPIMFETEVIRVQQTGDGFYVETTQGVYESKNVIVATGAFQYPRIPQFANELSKEIYQVHSSQYKNPNQLIKGNVLIVGGGNSGAQIAVELSKEKETYLAISNKIAYLPLSFQSKSIFWWFDKLGILKANTHSFLGKIIRKKGDPIFGYELKNAIKRKEVIIKSKVIEGKQNQITFDDLSTLIVNNVIWATGFISKYPWLNIEGVFNNKGEIIHSRGVSNIKGLYFIGLPWQYRRGSALLQGVGQNAEFIAHHLKDLSK